jgi:dethiobiotin synthetase
VGNVLLVTGTDTGVGKTYVAAGVAGALAASGARVVAIKPVETGCGERVDSGEDGARLAAATGQREPAAALVRLRTPVAPAVAADLEGVRLDFAVLAQQIAAHASDADVAIVEGAGGLLAPITHERNGLDLARALGAAALVVASDRLGTINHTLLTLRALAGVHVLGVVLSAPAVFDESTGTNAAEIRRHAGHQDVDTGWVGTLRRGAAGADFAGIAGLVREWAGLA